MRRASTAIPSTPKDSRGSKGNSMSPSGDGRVTRRPPPERTVAEKQIVDAEHFKVNIMPPTGKSPEVIQNMDQLFHSLTQFLQKMANEDDEFFHITCHVDVGLKAKIERGEFVELERLLPCDRLSKLSDDKALTLVNRDGNTYFVPSDSSSGKITKIRHWEQAFRVYAAVYSNANPSRSAEIWQYVYVINTAPSSFQWENVAHYDFTFRQLMHANPNHSWGKTYTQLWNIAMKDPIHHSSNNYSSAGNESGRVTYRDWCDNCCWRYNRGKLKKWNCKFDCRCNYCGAYNHASINCFKKKNSHNHNRDNRDDSRHSEGKCKHSSPNKSKRQ